MGKMKNLNKKNITRTHRFAPYSSTSDHSKKGCKYVSRNKDLDNITCSVCLESPHNGVLILCSSHDKGCRPFLCATSYRHSNCLDQYKKANTKVISIRSKPSFYDPCLPMDGKPKPELLCPLCRGQVKGWTVVDPIRMYLNAKKRTCMQDSCSFLGSYKALKKHMKATHPCIRRPREVDPILSEKWKQIENEREVADVYSTIRSTMPGAIVVGDYVIERNYHNFPGDFDTDDSDLDDDLAMEWGDYGYSSSIIDSGDRIEPARAPAWGRFGRFDFHRCSRIRARTRSLLGRSRRQQRQ